MREHLEGLTSGKAKEILTKVGENAISSHESFSAVSLFLSQFPTFINGILLLAMIFSFSAGDRIDGFFILATILLNGILGFVQEYRAEKSLEKLKKLTTSTSRVIRDGKEQVIESRFLVPGDIVILSEGDRIPADGRLTSSTLEVDEAIITGESIPVVKQKADPLLLGTLIVKGKGHFEVEKTGMQTKFGEIAGTLTSIETDATPLQKDLTKLGKTISFIALIIALSLIPLGIWRGLSLLPVILVAVSIGIAAVPEGLPAVITIALALGTSRMAKKKTIVRKMPAIETLGAVQIILVDKTGTLTQNQMRVKEFWTPEKSLLPHMLQACVLGNTASLLPDTDGKTEIVGDKTDGALLLWAKEQKETNPEGKVIDEYAFDSENRTITTIWKEKAATYTYVRGAPEAILEKSTLSGKEKKEVEEQFNEYAKRGLRVIACGYKKLPGPVQKREIAEDGLHFLGILGIYDPPRPEVKKALEEASRAGIRTIMVTGDNEITARAIAKEIGLMKEEGEVLTGDVFEKLSDQELLEVLPKTTIFARSQPHDKLRITTLLQQQGYIVGVTGDGVNDALALKKADVGIAMGESGTDVAKEESDIIIADDNFATLVSAIAEGRSIYQNIVKAIVYLLAGNLSELSLVFFAAVVGLPMPLLPTQILWINLVTDGLPALSLSTDNTFEDILKHKPRDPKTPVLNKKRGTFILLVGLGLGLYLLVNFHLLLGIVSLTASRTIIFNLLIISHLCLAFFIRGQSIKKINKLLMFATIVTLLLQTLITTVPFFQNIFHLGW